jgi:N-acetylgalactosamine-6-sulfatase
MLTIYTSRRVRQASPRLAARCIGGILPPLGLARRQDAAVTVGAGIDSPTPRGIVDPLSTRRTHESLHHKAQSIMNQTWQNRFAVRIVGLCFHLGLLVTVTAAPPTDQPNIVFILADDLGYGDLGCYGHPEARTPNLDQLARQGVRFTQHYSNGPECSPTRTALLTGRYQQRAGGMECAIGTGNVGRYDEAVRLAQQRELGLPAEQALIPTKLKEAGYTCAVFGKWHLGYEPKFNPIQHGWDSFFGYLGGNVHYFNHRETSDLHVLFNGRMPVYRDGYMTTMITDDSIAFIKQQKGPFFLYVAHECPHFPFQGPDDADKLVTEENWMECDPAAYVAMLENLDAEVGRILRAIDDQGIAGNTLVVFASDNGGFEGAAHMGPLRGAKGTTLEGGIRVPMIARWPGQIDPNSTCQQVTLTFDLTRSFLRLAQADVDDQQLDGYDIIRHIREGAQDVSRTVFWRGKRGDRTWSAVRDGDLKYVRKDEGNQRQQWLFDLSRDVGETTDLAPTLAGETARLARLLESWEAEVVPIR